MKMIDVRFLKWFPPNDEFAAMMARLCILREDLIFEQQSAIESKHTPETDEYGYEWRLMYFFRKISITLSEILSTIDGLSKDKNFKIFLAKKSANFKNDFDQLKKNLNSAKVTIREIRGNVGGAHIHQKSVEDALRNMAPERSGVLQVSPQTPTKTPYKFTNGLLFTLMVRDVSGEQEEIKMKKIINQILDVLKKLLPRIDLLFSKYAKDR